MATAGGGSTGSSIATGGGAIATGRGAMETGREGRELGRETAGAAAETTGLVSDSERFDVPVMRGFERADLDSAGSSDLGGDLKLAVTTGPGLGVESLLLLFDLK